MDFAAGISTPGGKDFFSTCICGVTLTDGESGTASNGFSAIHRFPFSGGRAVPAVRRDSNDAIVDRISSRTELVGGAEDIAVFRVPNSSGFRSDDDDLRILNSKRKRAGSQGNTRPLF